MLWMLLSALLASSPPATAGGSSTVTSKPAAPAASEKLICRRQTAVGSNRPGKRVCKTKSQILAEQAAARDLDGSQDAVDTRD